MIETVAPQARRMVPMTGSGWTWVRLGLVATWLLLAVGAGAWGVSPAARPAGGLVSTVWGLEVAPWLGWTALAGTVASLACVVAGPEPWRATRWAWFWLMGNPFGLLAFLLLSGPTPGVLGPRTDRRLRGGWAFLIGSAVGAVLVGAGLR